MSINHPLPVHPVLGCVAEIGAVLKDVADVDPGFMSTPDKRAALLGLNRVAAQLEELRLRMLVNADDVAYDEGARDPAQWLASVGRRDRSECRRSLRLARALEGRWSGVATAFRAGGVNRDQVEQIVRALESLPADLDPDVLRQAEAHLVAEAGEFGPRSLRIMGRRVLDVVDPDAGDAQEAKALRREEADAARKTFLHTVRRGDGTVDIRMRVSELVADRLMTYLHAFTSPRRPGQSSGAICPDDRRPYDERLGHAFGGFLEAVDPARLPLHGGDATTMIITAPLEQLRKELGAVLVGDAPMSAAEARRLACSANLIPAVLGTESQVLDLGRASRFFKPHQRKALALTQPTCRAVGCEIPAAWCEAHHGGDPWARGGRTDLADGLLLCGFHHHRAHDHNYDTRRLREGRVGFHRRT